MEKLHLSQFADFLKPRARQFHKGDAGHVLIVGGNFGFAGAVRLAAEGALRVGAGLVSVATRPEHAVLLTMSRPEIMSHGVASVDELEKLIAVANVIVIGPGLGQTDWSKQLLARVLQSEKPLVVDADALNLIALQPCKKENWIITPHPGEASRLLKLPTKVVQSNRLAAIKELKKEYGGVSVLKGAGTLILDDAAEPMICEAGNPGMATGGMGDVLSGVIGGLVAQHLSISMAAKLGVLVHALAGDRATEFGERGMIASDLYPYLRELVNWE